MTCETRSISKTAIRLNIAQPAVSTQIRALEKYLGFQLFLRNKKNLQLTKEGKALFDRTHHLFNGICKEVGGLLSTSEDLVGTLRIGCLSEVGEKLFVKPISRFKENHPELQIQILFLKTHEIKELLKTGELDLGIIPDKIIQENIKTYDLLNEEVILVTNSGNKDKKVLKMSELPFIAYREGDPLLGFYLKKLQPRASFAKLNIQMMANSHKAMVQLLLSHPFYAVLPKYSVEKELQEETLVQVGQKTLLNKLYLVTKDLHIPDRKVELFRTELLKYIREGFKHT